MGFGSRVCLDAMGVGRNAPGGVERIFEDLELFVIVLPLGPWGIPIQPPTRQGGRHVPMAYPA
jgi:hypothetical protein